MEEKKTYYISLEERRVRTEFPSDKLVYEVHATPTEIVEFESLLNENDDKEFIFALKSIPFKPFAEGEVEEMREETHDNYLKAYEFVYDKGTEETREKLKEIGYDR